MGVLCSWRRATMPASAETVHWSGAARCLPKGLEPTYDMCVWTWSYVGDAMQRAWRDVAWQVGLAGVRLRLACCRAGHVAWEQGLNLVGLVCVFVAAWHWHA